MDKVFTVAQVVVPIFVAIFLGVIARRKSWLTQSEVRGLQQFVMKIGLPCVVFSSCLKADIGVESLSSMALVITTVLAATLWAFRFRQKKMPYHNFPMLFCAQESGMLGIPLYIILFGAAEAYRVGVLDLAQALTAYPVIAILSADTGENPSVPEIAKKALTSPLMVMSLSGLLLNITGVGRWMDAVGIGPVVEETVSFLAQPVSALMIFSVGFNFSLAAGNRSVIFKISAIHFAMFFLAGLVMQLVMCLIPNVDMLTRWAIFMYSILPSSYISLSLGRSEDDFTVSSGVCSVLTIVTLAIFCVITVLVA